MSRPDDEDHLLRVSEGGVRTIDCGLPTIPTEKYRRNYYINTAGTSGTMGVSGTSGGVGTSGGLGTAGGMGPAAAAFREEGLRVADYASRLRGQVRWNTPSV